jgi:hypothetical protein
VGSPAQNEGSRTSAIQVIERILACHFLDDFICMFTRKDQGTLARQRSLRSS